MVQESGRLTATADWRALFAHWSACIAAGQPQQLGCLDQASLERLLGATGQVGAGLRGAQAAMRFDPLGSFLVAYYLMAVRGVEALSPPPWVVPPGATEPPQVSLVLPVHNQWTLTLNCLRSLLLARTAIRCEVLLADDASTDATPQIAAGNPWLQAAGTSSNLGFLDNCNQAAALARGEVLVFLNNDTLVGDHWLDCLWSTLAACPGTGVVGSQVYAADGPVLESGGICWADGEVWNHGRGFGPERQFLLNHRRKVDYVSGCALAIRRDLWSRLGGFDPVYRPAYAEDTDLCLRARQAGMAVMVQPWSRIVHLEGLSHSRSLEEGLKRHQVRNLQTFRQRWQGVLRAEQLLDTRQWLLASDRGLRRGPVVLVLASCLAEAALERAVQGFQALDFKVVVLPEVEPDQPGSRRRLEEAGVLCLPARPAGLEGPLHELLHGLEESLRRVDVLLLCSASDLRLGLSRLALLQGHCPEALALGPEPGGSGAAGDRPPLVVLGERPLLELLRQHRPQLLEPRSLRPALSPVQGLELKGLRLLAGSQGVHADRWIDRDNLLVLELAPEAPPFPVLQLPALQLEVYLPEQSAVEGEPALECRIEVPPGPAQVTSLPMAPGLNRVDLALPDGLGPASLLLLRLRGQYRLVSAAAAEDQRPLLAVLTRMALQEGGRGWHPAPGETPRPIEQPCLALQLVGRIVPLGSDDAHRPLEVQAHPLGQVRLPQQPQPWRRRSLEIGQPLPVVAGEAEGEHAGAAQEPGIRSLLAQHQKTGEVQHGLDQRLSRHRGHEVRAEEAGALLVEHAIDAGTEPGVEGVAAAGVEAGHHPPLQVEPGQAEQIGPQQGAGGLGVGLTHALRCALVDELACFLIPPDPVFVARVGLGPAGGGHCHRIGQLLALPELQHPPGDQRGGAPGSRRGACPGFEVAGLPCCQQQGEGGRIRLTLFREQLGESMEPVGWGLSGLLAQSQAHRPVGVELLVDAAMEARPGGELQGPVAARLLGLAQPQVEGARLLELEQAHLEQAGLLGRSQGQGVLAEQGLEQLQSVLVAVLALQPVGPKQQGFPFLAGPHRVERLEGGFRLGVSKPDQQAGHLEPGLEAELRVCGEPLGDGQGGFVFTAAVQQVHLQQAQPPLRRRFGVADQPFGLVQEFQPLVEGAHLGLQETEGDGMVGAGGVEGHGLLQSGQTSMQVALLPEDLAPILEHVGTKWPLHLGGVECGQRL
nr:glycosyltransferase family 2 protein [Cyanobium sp. NIES-981]